MGVSTPAQSTIRQPGAASHSASTPGSHCAWVSIRALVCQMLRIAVSRPGVASMSASFSPQSAT
jgi:hypothetical protein